MPNPILSLGLALTLLFSSGYNFAVAQEAEITGGIPSVNDINLKVEQVASGLVSPTTMAFLDEDTILVLEKDNGRVVMIEGGGIDGDDMQGVPPAGNRLYRYELQGDQLVNPKLLLDLPALPGPRYNGGPVVIGPDNNVYIIIGDVGGHATQVQNFENSSAADGTSGILRIGKNGEVPEAVIGTGSF